MAEKIITTELNFKMPLQGSRQQRLADIVHCVIILKGISNFFPNIVLFLAQSCPENSFLVAISVIF